MTNSKKPTIGIIGAGRLGTAVATQLLKAKYQVQIANSKSPETLKLILSVLLPEAHAGTADDVIRHNDIIILAIPLHKYTALAPDLFARKIIIDAMNYWPTTEGTITAFENPNSTSSEYIQTYFPKAIVIKTLNHVAYHELNEHALPPGTPNRRAIVLAGDDGDAKEKVAQMISAIGFDPVDLGNLAQGKKFQPDTKLFNARYTVAEMKEIL